MSVEAEIARQAALLKREGRKPAFAQVGRDEYAKILCSERTWSFGYGVSYLGLLIERTPRAGVLVIPEDWRGYGQGRVRA